MNNLILRDPIMHVPVTNLLPSIFSRQMNRLFQNPFNVALSSTANGPAVNVYETNDCYIFQAELPGLMTEDGRQYHRAQGLYDQFTRSFTVPKVVDLDRVRVELKDGILTIHLPKRDEAKPRQSEVKQVL